MQPHNGGYIVWGSHTKNWVKSLDCVHTSHDDEYNFIVHAFPHTLSLQFYVLVVGIQWAVIMQALFFCLHHVFFTLFCSHHHAPQQQYHSDFVPCLSFIFYVKMCKKKKREHGKEKV